MPRLNDVRMTGGVLITGACERNDHQDCTGHGEPSGIECECPCHLPVNPNDDPVTRGEARADKAAKVAPWVDVSHVTEYGLTQRLSRAVRVF